MRRLPTNAALVAAGAVAIGFSRFAFRARIPDDYDAIGFVLALDRFDLARFQPHFPGYPVYVALGRVMHALLPDALSAATAVSAIAAAATAIGLWVIARRLFSVRAGYIAMALYAVASLPFLLAGSALSDGTAAAFFVLALAAQLEKCPFVSGAAIALMVGTRASYFPIALTWLALLLLNREPKQLARIARALVGAAMGTIAWAAPFVRIVGAQRLLALGRTHLHGHFADWGGSIATQPDLWKRTTAFARDLFYDGLAPQWWALAALALIVIASIALRARSNEARFPSRNSLLSTLILTLPYALWAFFGQNIVEQPRHVLPLVLTLIVALAGQLTAPDAQLFFAAAAVAVMALSSVPLALAHARTAPAAAQLADYVKSHYAPKEVAVYGGRSTRFFSPLVDAGTNSAAYHAYPSAWLSEVDVSLERLDVLPHHVLVTSEIEVDRRRAQRLKPGPRFCRDERLDRAHPCLTLSEYFILQGRTP